MWGRKGTLRAGRRMLLRFEAANFRSILEPVELSMIAVDRDRPAAREVDLLTERVLAVSGIYGPNASGKSNAVEALAWLSAAVGRSLRTWDQFVPREPFKFGPGLLTPSTHEVEMAVRGVRYAYRVEVDDPEVSPFGRHLSGIRVLGARRHAPWRRLQAGGGGAGQSSTERLFDSE